MKADMDDMPEYLKTRKQESPWRMVAIMAIGTGVVVGGLSLFGGGLIDRAKTIASGEGLRDDIGLLQPQPKEQKISTPRVAHKEERNPLQSLKSDSNQLIISQSKPIAEQPQLIEWEKPEKQTTFNDQNYKPKGAINLVNAREWGTAEPYEETRKRQKQQEIVVVGQEQKPGDWVCTFVGGEGSIERRNCKSGVQLHKRNTSYSGNRNP